MTSFGSGYFFAYPPKCNKNGGQEGAMWILKEEAFLSTKGLGRVLHAGFDAELSVKEEDVLDITMRHRRNNRMQDL